MGTKRGDSARGGVTGWGIDDEIVDAYTWLIQNFDDGDEIFVFGFSRGAYTARSLSGMICKCGVLNLGAPLSIQQLYARYRIYDAPTIRSLQGKPLPDGASIEDRSLVTFSRASKVRFVGVWDTVGSLGLPFGKRRRPSSEISFPRYASAAFDNEYAFHALGLDEHRRSFEPAFWTKTDQIVHEGAGQRPIDSVEQRWFVGAHANVGGGYASDPLAQRPLEWLMEKAAGLGLVFRDWITIDVSQTTPPVADSYRDFAWVSIGSSRGLSIGPSALRLIGGQRRRHHGSTKPSTDRFSTAGAATNHTAQKTWSRGLRKRRSIPQSW
ncbi:DUF2235 domain-containing protein (plasmid) [Bradyrhizobium barranii]|uniref:DUF2235 domain-containing protein n=1 Tax=Bradyrhizobium barranii TaxID=2992140 RepID=A0ABY3R1J8_9BRAD|nr:DUF2235 domain-containing protein [Bradyrhizobium japonicum]